MSWIGFCHSFCLLVFIFCYEYIYKEIDINRFYKIIRDSNDVNVKELKDADIKVIK